MFSEKEKREQPSKHLTLKEVAILAGVTPKAIRHELEDKVARPQCQAKRRLWFGEREVFYFYLVSSLPFELKKSDRKDLFNLIAFERARMGCWSRLADGLALRGSVPTELRTVEIERDLAKRLRLFLRGKGRVESRPEVLGGESVFEGTRISVRHVGQLMKQGVPESELLEDFPSLSREDLKFARMFVDLGRPPGRPKKLRFIREQG